MNSNFLVDSHCHISLEPRDLDPERDNIKDIIKKQLDTKCSNDSELILNIMSTTHFDHELLSAGNAFNDTNRLYKLGLGIHPWYCYLYTFDKSITKLDHYLSILTVDHKEVAEKLKIEATETSKIEEFIQQSIKENFHLYPDMHYIGEIYTDDVFSKYDFIGEVGLDFKATVKKIADLSDQINYKINQQHQIKVFDFFLQKFINKSNLKFISIHSVKASQATFDAIKLIDNELQKKNTKLNIVLHSYAGTIDQFNQQYLKLKNINTFISLSSFINCKMPLTKKQKNLISQLNPKNMLIETDVPINTEMQGFCFKHNLENTLNVIHELKDNISLDELRTEINNNYARIMDSKL